MNMDEEITLDSLMEDEDLQKELRALGWRDAPTNPSVQQQSKAKPMPPPPPPQSRKLSGKNQVPQKQEFPVDPFEEPFDIESIANVGIVDDNLISFDDRDLNDPELLSMYQDLHEDTGDNHHEEIHSTAHVLPPPLVKQPSQEKRVEVDFINGDTVTSLNDDIFSNANITAEEATKRALQFRRDGNTTEALKWFRLSKQLESANNGKVASSSKPAAPPKPMKVAPAPPPKPAKPVSVASSVPMKTAEPTPAPMLQATTSNATSSKKSVLTKDQYEIFEQALVEASNSNLKEAKRFKELNQNQLALEKMRKYKYYQQELSVLHSRKQEGIPGIPPFSWKTHRKEEKIENIEIAENELKLQIIGLYNIEGLINLHNHKTISLNINFGKGNNETDDILEIPGVKANTENIVEYNFTRTLPILKRSKLAQQLYSRKKITIELLMNKGLFRGLYVVAMAIIPLADLLNKCSTGGDIPLYSVDKASDGSNKKGKLIGGVLKMQVTIRTPLVTPEMKVTEERELVIEAWPSVTPVSPPVAPAPTAIPAASSSMKPPASTPVSPPAAVAPVTTDSNQKKKLEELAQQLTDKEKNDPENIEFIVSNDVFEAEIQSIQNDLASGKVTDEGDQFALNIRLQTLQAKLQFLVFSVQNETLSFEEYLNQLKGRIEKDKKLLLYQKLLDTPESKAIAIKFLRRIKIMEAEVKNAEEAGEEDS